MCRGRCQFELQHVPHSDGLPRIVLWETSLLAGGYGFPSCGAQLPRVNLACLPLHARACDQSFGSQKRGPMFYGVYGRGLGPRRRRGMHRAMEFVRRLENTSTEVAAIALC